MLLVWKARKRDCRTGFVPESLIVLIAPYQHTFVHFSLDKYLKNCDYKLMQRVYANFSDGKKEIELSMARIIMTKLQQNVISFETSTEIARYILAKIDAIQDEEAMLKFLQDLNQKYSIFDTLSELYKIRIRQNKLEDDQLTKVQENLKTEKGETN